MNKLQQTEREKKLAKALRENLLKRKQQQRERVTAQISEDEKKAEKDNSEMPISTGESM